MWRVYKLESFDGAPQLADVLKGRTSYAMSGEVKPAKRIGFKAIEPGDVLFFGSRGPKSKPAEVGHMGIAVGNGWFVHSSGNGVTLQPLTGLVRDELRVGPAAARRSRLHLARHVQASAWLKSGRGLASHGR